MEVEMITKEDISIITPDKNVLDSTDDNLCPIQGCEREFKSSSALRFHLNKSHGQKSAPTQCYGKQVMYACPAHGCPRNAKSPRQHFFRLLFELKKHYQRIHGEKKYPCSKCGKKFGWYPAKATHEDNCQKLFYCSCGAYYTTLKAVQTHAYRKGKNEHQVLAAEKTEEHNTVADGESNVKSSLQTISIPAMLYIPKMITPQGVLQVENKIIIPKSSSSISKSAEQGKFVRILPKLDQQYVKDNIPVTMPTENPLLVNVSASNNKLKDKSKALHQNKPDGKKLSKYERNMLYLASNEVQDLLSDPVLLCDAAIRKKIEDNIKKKSCRCKKDICKHITEKLLKLGDYYNHTEFSMSDVYNEIGSSALRLADTCTQTMLSVSGIDNTTAQPSCKTHQKAGHVIENIEVLETSDFSMQCQFSLDEMHQKANTLVATQTQTDENIDSWLNSFECAEPVNIQTQTSQPTSNMVTQTEYFSETETPIFLDKSIQLDSLWSTNNLLDSTNIGTQTSYNESWLNDDFDAVLRNSDKSMSTQTNSEFDIGFTNIDFSVQHNDDITGTCSAFDRIPVSPTKNTTETQTTISFYDLLDSNFIDDYLNEEREKMSIETQTIDESFSQSSINMQTQTDYFF